MRKHFSKIFSVMAALLVGLTVASPVHAANYTPVAGGSVTLNKYLVVDAQAEIPAAEFNFSIAAGSAVEATADTVKVWAGLNPELVKIGDAAGEADGKVAFTAGQATTAGAASDGIANSTDKKYARTDLIVDFSAVSFPEPGVYRYVLTEGAVAAPFTGDAIPARTIDVYVEDEAGALVVKQYVVYEGAQTAGPSVDGADLGTKTDKYVNAVDTVDLKIGKDVAGNQASQDQYFEVKVTFAGLGAGTILNVDVATAAEAAPLENAATQHAAADMATANGITTITAGADGAAEHTFYLKHGQRIDIKGIPAGATYKYEETDAAAGYTKSGEIATATALTADTTSVITNTRTGTIPTGVIMKVLPYASLLVLAAAAIALNLRKKESL